MTLPTASVVICAYTMERWDDLRSAVVSAATGSVVPHEIVVVIDHNEALFDRARRFGDEVAHEHGLPVTVVPNAHPRGLSGGRNTALDLVAGDVIAFLDDDAVAEPDWLAALLAPYADDSVVGVGGAARPVWPSADSGGRPLMYPAASVADRGEFDWVVGCSYRGMPTSATPIRNLMGCNMSFRRSVFSRVGAFTDGLGRVGKIPLGCEETEFCIRVRQSDPALEIIFEPAAIVRHRVSADRVRWWYLFRRCYAEGLSKVAVSRLVGQQAALESERRYVRQVLPAAVAREAAAALRGRRAGFAGVFAIGAGLVATACGYVRGAWARPGAPARGDDREPLSVVTSR